MPLAYMSDANKVAVVTGSSSGIGYETSLALAREGFLTYATMRNLEKGSGIKSVSDKENLPLKLMQLDVTDDASVSKAVQSIVSDSGRIDVIVNNAGYGLVGAFEDLSLDEIKQQYETNFFGVVRVTQAVIPVMRKQKSGKIINISSGAGRFGYPGGSAYVSTKFAMEGLSESLSYELDPFGIKVILVEPGVIRTNFGNGMVVAKKSQDPASAYLSMTRKMNDVLGQLMQNGSPPSLVANLVLQAAKSDTPNLRYLAGKDVEQWVDQKKKMSDKEFFNMMNQLFK
jgi:NAD(P)-dependent dehydrogenase (short-subunit alcohol dehydrogenase family)